MPTSPLPTITQHPHHPLVHPSIHSTNIPQEPRMCRAWSRWCTYEGNSDAPCSYRVPVKRESGTAVTSHPTLGITEVLPSPWSLAVMSNDNACNRNIDDETH